MTLENTLLQKVAEWRPGGERKTLNVPHPESGWNVILTAERCDELSSLLWEVKVQRIADRKPSITLEGWANGIAERARGLIEDLQVHEIDSVLNQALLRSHEPTERNGGLYYFEVHLNGTGEATLKRFKSLPGAGRREQVLFALTHEGLAKLAKDVATA